MDISTTSLSTYPNYMEELAWVHDSIDDAELCDRDRSLRPWPMPKMKVDDER